MAESAAAKECGICFMEMDVYIQAITKCGHSFCEKCLAKWAKDCPLCRTPIEFKTPIEQLRFNVWLAAKKHDFKQSFETLSKACELAPYDSNLSVLRGNVTSKAIHHAVTLGGQDGLLLANLVVEQNPTYLLGKTVRAKLRKQQGDMNGCLNDLDSVLRLDSSFTLALCLRSEWGSDKAKRIDDLRALIILQPDNIHAIDALEKELLLGGGAQ